MSAFERYLVRLTASAFIGAVVAVTAVVWVSQSLREFDLITTRGQSFWTFFAVTALAAPYFALLVAPVALFGAVVYVLNRLNADSELPVLSAAGVTPLRLMRPFWVVSIIVALAVGILSTSAIPASLRKVRDIITAIHADVIVNVLREGEFTQLDRGVTIHIRRRDAGAALIGVMIADNRDRKQDIVYTAERGQVVKTDQGTYLVMENGTAMRKATGEENASLVTFDRYAFDLSPFQDDDVVISYKPREQYISGLWKPPSDVKSEAALGRIRSELHDRLTTPLYPVAFMCIAFAALGRPQSNRQSRFAGILAAVLAVVAVRVASLWLTNQIAVSAWAVPALYILPLAVCAISLWMVLGPGLMASRTRSPQPRTA
ncbi:LPS export ABC transporter permease LptF [Flaviflagellibacter deserti]|uniref:LPS export ABC transporter permease LptF n=1 Tax=Flaviflagellibacter deserti TaxID=2267266 RepID=A0ABV9Z2L7_9HYPH